MRFTTVLFFLLAFTAGSPIQRMQTLLVQYFTTVAYYATIAVDYPEPTTFVSSVVTWAPGPIKTLISTFDEEPITATELRSYTMDIVTEEPEPSSTSLSVVSDFGSSLFSKESSLLLPTTSVLTSEVAQNTGADMFQDMPPPTSSSPLNEVPSAPIFEWDNDELDRQRPLPGSWDDDILDRQRTVPGQWETGDKGQQNQFPEPWEWNSITAEESITRSATSESVDTDHGFGKDLWETTQSYMGQAVSNDDTASQSAPLHSLQPEGKPYFSNTEIPRTTSLFTSEDLAYSGPSTKKESFWEPVSEASEKNTGFKNSTSLAFTGKTTVYTTPTSMTASSDASSEFEKKTVSSFPTGSPLGFSSTITMTRRCTKSTASFDKTSEPVSELGAMSTSRDVSVPSAVFSASDLNRYSTTGMEAVKRPIKRSSTFEGGDMHVTPGANSRTKKNFFPFSTMVSIVTSAADSDSSAAHRSTFFEPSAPSLGQTDSASTLSKLRPSWDVDSEFPLPSSRVSLIPSSDFNPYSSSASFIESTSLFSSPTMSSSSSELKVTGPAFTECPCVFLKTRKSELASSDRPTLSEVTFEPGLTLSSDQSSEPDFRSFVTTQPEFSMVTLEPGLTSDPDFVPTKIVSLETSLTFEESVESSFTTEPPLSQVMSEVPEVSTIERSPTMENIVMSTITEPSTFVVKSLDSEFTSFAGLSISSKVVEAKSLPSECVEHTVTADRTVCGGAILDSTSRPDLETPTGTPTDSFVEPLATKTSLISDSPSFSASSSQELAQISLTEKESSSSGKFHTLFPTGNPESDLDSDSDSNSDPDDSDSDSEFDPDKCRMLVPNASQTASLASSCSDICKDVGPSQENCGLEVAANYGGRRVEVMVADRKGDSGSCDLRFSPAECSTDKKREGRLNFAWNWL